MNKRNITPVLMVFFSLMAVIPEVSPLVHAQGSPTVAVTPSFNAADQGSTFQVAVNLDGVSSVIGYDVILTWSTNALSATALNCFGSGTLFSSAPFGSVFPVTQAIDNSAGSVECSAALLGGASVDATFGGSLMIVTFQALGPFPSDLIIVSPQVIQLVNGGAQQVSVSIVNGTFLSPPVLAFILPNATTAPGQRVRHLFKGQTTVDLQGFIMLSTNAPFAGFGGVEFTIVDPAGNSFVVDSNINFMPIGGSTTVTASFDIGAANGGLTGTYHLFGTLLRCPLPNACALGATTQGLDFKVKA